MALARRPFTGVTDLPAMQDLATRLWRAREALADWTPGDLAWWFHGPSSLKHETVGLWEEDGRLVAWGWVTEPADLELMIDPAAPDSSAVVEDVLAWLAEEVVRRTSPGGPPPAWGVWSIDFDPLVRELEERGFRPGEKGFVHTIRSLEEPFPPRAVPDGYEVRPLRGEEEIEQRVEVHRAAFAPSKMTVDVYRGLMRSESYRDMAVDMVAVAPDGSFASFCICWNIASVGVAELEPVGTHPDHQRKGLATAVCTAALEEAARRGATLGLVDHNIGAGAATHLYEVTLGFREVARHRRYEQA
jgi:ribosomal protein S18 acetylase RimI-like enzyme